MWWIVSVAYEDGELTPLFKAKSLERAVDLLEQFRQRYPVCRSALTHEDGLGASTPQADPPSLEPALAMTA